MFVTNFTTVFVIIHLRLLTKERNRDMTMLKIPLTESVWGNIQTSKDNHFIITSDVASSKYYLYIKQGQEYNRLSYSKQPYKLLQDIQNYEKRNML